MIGRPLLRRLAYWLSMMLAPLVCQTAATAQPTVGNSAPVRVLSGEHTGFTRLSLAIGTGTDWHIGRVADGYGIVISTNRSFATDRVFDTIRRGRIADLRALPGRLELSLACDCRLTAFSYLDNWLVVDVADTAPDRNSRFEVPLDPSATVRTTNAPFRPVPLIAGPPPFRLIQGTFPLIPPLRQPEGRPAFEEQMVADLLRGAGQGLVDLSRPLPAPPDAAPPPVVPRQPAGFVAHDGNGPGVVAHTTFDRDLALARTAIVGGQGGCLPDADFDLPGWAGSGDFAAEIALARAALTAEFDTVPAGAAERLARTYIAFGFGREAREILMVDGQRSHERDRLNLLAALIDGDPVTPDALADQTACVGTVTLWAALAQGSLDGISEPGRIAIGTAFRMLPSALRGHLGPRLVGLFSRSGDPFGAAQILEQASQTDGATTAATVVAAAGLEQTSGTSGAALDRLSSLADTDPRLDPAGLIAMIDLAIDRGQMPDPSDLALLRSMRFEYRHQPENLALSLAELRVLSSQGHHAEAVAQVSHLPAIARSEALGPVLTALTVHAGDAAFLNVALGALPAQPPPEVANVVAARLVALGFPDPALTYLTPSATGDAMAERRYLRADAALMLGRAALVEAELLGLADARADALRAQAGLPLAEPANAASPGADTAWRAADWPVLAGAEDPLLRAAAEAMQTPDTRLPEGTPLAARHALIAEAEAARALARALLDRYRAPP